MTQATTQSSPTGQTLTGGPAPITVTSSAAKKISEIIQQESYENFMFRISITGGGCSGFKYQLAFDDQVNEDDMVFEQDGVKLVTDSVSGEMLEGAQLDYTEDMMGASFRISNPNAKTGCGCGNSFSV